MELINQLLPRLEELRLLAYLFILLISFLESLAFVGLLIPGTVFLILVGFVISKGVWDPGNVFIFAVVGATLGDLASFYLGSHGKILFQPKNKVFKLSYLEKGKSFFAVHGNKSVFLGRFLGPIRPIIPFVAGMCHMNRGKFFLYNLASALIWSALYLALGYFFGAALGELIAVWFARFGLALVGIAVLVVLLLTLLRYKIRRKRVKN